jgi:KipI family sensor histidine kinase inhibitor
VTDSPRLEPLGEAALLLRWRARAPSREMAQRVRSVWEAVRAARLDGVIDVVPAPASLLLRFDPGRSDRADLERRLAELVKAGASPDATPVARHVVEVTYGGEHGPDLEEVADRLSLTPEEVISLHTSETLTVLATGFTPGFVYLGPLSATLELPRRERPRTRVPAGSVAIAERQTGIYCVESAGGWWLIGSTSQAAFRPDADPPVAFAIGDQVTMAGLR